MKSFQPLPKPAVESPGRVVARRSVLVGTGVAAAAAAAAHLAGRGLSAAPAGPVAAVSPEPGGDGYQVTQHVLRYYETAKV